MVFKPGQEGEKATLAQVKATVEGAAGFDVNSIEVCPDGGSEWKPLVDVAPEAKNWVPF